MFTGVIKPHLYIFMLETSSITLPHTNSLIMPQGPIHGGKHFLHYEDSGVPSDSTTYITVFFVHGTMFHGGKTFFSGLAACTAMPTS